MTTNKLHRILGVAAAATLLTVMLGGCGKEPPATEPATPPPAAPADQTPAAPSSEVPPPDAAEPVPSPAPTPPPPTDPSAAPKPTAENVPLESMHAAIPSAKISVPVDLRYQFDGDALAGQPVTLHLAAVPRVAGTRLRVSIKRVPGLEVAAGPLEVQKASAAGIYRQQLSITRSATGPAALRVLVTMDQAEGSGFGYFTVPLTSGNPPQKQQSVKQR